MQALHQIDAWDVPFAAAGLTRADEVVATRGDVSRAVRLASVSKPITALATLVAAEEGVVDLEELFSRGGVFAPLREPSEFAKVRVDRAFGAVVWPGDVDLDPDALYARLG